MSPARSSSAARLALAFVLLAIPVGCAKTGDTATTVRGGAGNVGFVRMSDLVKKHPLYPQLARLDQDVEALTLKAAAGSVAATAGATLAREEAALQKQLEAAAQRTQAQLKAKQDDYAKREQAAIRAALGGVGNSSGPSGAAIQNGIRTTYEKQARTVTADAQKNMTRYRGALIAQNQTAINDLERSLNDRAAREFRAKSDDLQKKEADFSYEQASENSAERLSLRTKLSNLALDDATREEARKTLEAIDRKEADALAAMRNRDQATLATLNVKLRREGRDELQKVSADMNRRALAKITARENETRSAVIGQIKALPAQGGGGVAGPAGLPPDMQNKIKALHEKYQADFTKDANVTIAQFQKTRGDLTRRYEQLRGVDSGAQGGARRQIETLQKQRGELYDQMVAQIGREVKTIAVKRGVSVVFSEILAPAGGVDLTADAEKDIESLHE